MGAEKLSNTVEQYLKTIYQQTLRGKALVEIGMVVEAMGVAPATVTAMMHTLAAAGFIDYQPRRGVELTERGRIEGQRLLRRHRLIETFLERVLGYDLSEVHPDAEDLEHAASDTYIDKIDALLNYPTVDPHGSPIPGAPPPPTQVPEPLPESPPGCVRQIVRVEPRPATDTTLAAELKARHLVAGEQIRITDNSPALGTMTIEHIGTGQSTPISIENAGCFLVVAPPTSTRRPPAPAT